MDRDKIGARQRRVEITDRLTTDSSNFISRFIGVIHLHIHFHGEAPLGGARSDAAEADDQHRLAEEVVGQFAKPLFPAPVFTRLCISPARLASVSIINSACS